MLPVHFFLLMATASPLYEATGFSRLGREVGEGEKKE